MKNKINMITRLGFSINPKKYIYLVKDSLAKALLYLLLIATILGVFQGITAISMLSIIQKSTQIAFAEDKLKFEMNKGILEFEASPFKEEQGPILLLVDTNKKLSEVDSLRNIYIHKDLSTIFLSDGFMVRSGSDELMYKYSEIGLDAIDFDNKTIVNIVNQFSILKYFIIPILIVVKFISMCFLVFMISLAGLISTWLNKQNISYKNILKLSLYAITLPILINIVIPLGVLQVFIGGVLLILGLNFTFYNKKA